MTLEWSVVKYIPDIWRNEPKNVGIVVRAESDALLRFFGETKPGKVDGRSARRRVADTDSYKGWVQYFRRKVAAGKWDEVLESQRRRPDFPYVVSPGGLLPEANPDSMALILDDLYREMVAEREAAHATVDEVATSGDTRSRVKRILTNARINVIEDVVVPAVFHSRDKSSELHQSVRFTFGYENGRHHLFESVPNRAAAYSFYARAEAAFNADSSINLLAMYPASRFSHAEAEINVIETYANAIDIDDEAAASRSVAELVIGGGS